MLEHRVSAADISRLVLTLGYERLLTANGILSRDDTATKGVLTGLLRREIERQGASSDVGRQPRRLMWEPRALDALEQLAEHMPPAARDALEAMERMASTGFNYGRLTRKGILWYLPRR
jgi:hypothetical protein